MKRPKLFVLDEPTSGLDPMSEAHIMSAMKYRAPGSTVLLFTHRISDLHLADVIHVMAGGKIVQR